MRSLERRFDDIQKRWPSYSSFICFSSAIKDQHFSKIIISKWFYKLVEKDDYAKEDRKALLAGLFLTSNPPEDSRKSG